ncbi:MAG: type II secretion system protein GspE, partial [Chloroflexota bacterium]
MSARLGEILVKENLINQEQLQKALEQQKAQGGRLGAALVKLGFISDEEITGVLSRQYGVPAINLSYYEVDPALVKLVPQETAQRYQVVPLSRVGSTLTIAMVDPTNVFAMDDIKFMTGLNVEPVVASETAINEAISKFYGAPAQTAAQTAEQTLDQVMQELEGGEADVEEIQEAVEASAAELEHGAEE